MGELKTREDVHALIAGLTLLGTGGGGRPEQGLDALLPHVESGRRLAWVDVGSLPDDAWVCSVFGMGSIAPSKPLTAVERRQLGYPAEWVVAKPMVRAPVAAPRIRSAFVAISELAKDEPLAVFA